MSANKNSQAALTYQQQRVTALLTRSHNICVYAHNKISHHKEEDMNLKPLGDRVVIKQLEAEETTKSGIVLPSQAKEKPQQAQVVAVGPGGVVDGKEIKMEVKPGDKVIYSKYAGTEVKMGEDELIIVKQNDILAIVE